MKKNMKKMAMFLTAAMLFSVSSVASADDGAELIPFAMSSQVTPEGLPAYVGIYDGFFEKYGLDVENFTYVSGPPQMEAIPSDTWRSGIAGIAASITGVLSYDLKTIGFSLWGAPSHEIFAREDCQIYQSGNGNIDGYPEIYGTVEDWKGATILCAKGTVGYLNLLSTLKALGLSEEDVNVVHMEIAAAYQAFKAGEGDLLVTWSTYGNQAVEEGWKKVSSAEASGLVLPDPILATEKAMEDPETLQKYMNAMFESMMWINDNTEEAAEEYYEMCLEEGVKSSEEACLDQISRTYAPTMEELTEMLEVGEDGMNGFQRTIADIMDFYIELGNYTEEDKQKMIDSVDTTFTEAAMANYESNH